MFSDPGDVDFSAHTVSIDGGSGTGVFAKGTSSVELKRTLTFTDGFAVVVGIMIGSGIFASPGLALQRAGSAGLVLIAWSLAGLLVSTSTLCYAELAAMIPTAGGDFDYLQRAYGDGAAFAFAWFNFWVGKPGSQAIIATVFGQYVVAIFSGDLHKSTDEKDMGSAKVIAVALVVILTMVNCSGIRESANLQNLLTTLKLILVLLVSFIALFFVTQSADMININLAAENAFRGSNGPYNFFSAMVACLWALDGWADLNFLAEEVINPERVLPLVMLVGVFTVTFCYVLTNIAYLAVLGQDEIIDTSAIAIDFGFKVTGGGILPVLLAFGVAICTAGSANGSIMTGGRAFYSVARNGYFPRSLAKLNSRGAPWTALLAQGAWCIVLLVLPGSSFSSLLNYFGPTSWLFYAFTVSGTIVLRHKEPNTHRPFRIPYYPIPPIVVFLFSICIVLSSLATDPLYCSLALGFVMLSYPAWRLSRFVVLKSTFPFFDILPTQRESLVDSGVIDFSNTGSDVISLGDGRNFQSLTQKDREDDL